MPKQKKKIKQHIGIIGLGVVGEAVLYGFKSQNVSYHDKYKPSESLEKVVRQSDYIFVCVPTPKSEDGDKIDLSILDSVIEKITPLTNMTDKIIIIKSTVVPGTTDNYIKKYKESSFCFNPEFLTERSPIRDFINANRIVIGTRDTAIYTRMIWLYRSIKPKAMIFNVYPDHAEMIKYMSNCFLATKVIFANEMFQICRKLDMDYDVVKQIVVRDKRIYDSHLDITKERGFGGKCFPKDLLALRSLARGKGVDTKILDAVWEKNVEIRK